MTLVTKFDMFQEVVIKAINQTARVIEIKLDGANLFYRVEYWWNGEVKGVYQSEDELK